MFFQAADFLAVGVFVSLHGAQALLQRQRIGQDFLRQGREVWIGDGKVRWRGERRSRTRGNTRTLPGPSSLRRLDGLPESRCAAGADLRIENPAWPAVAAAEAAPPAGRDDWPESREAGHVLQFRFF